MGEKGYAGLDGGGLEWGRTVMPAR
jgi:hypothetical protein